MLLGFRQLFGSGSRKGALPSWNLVLYGCMLATGARSIAPGWGDGKVGGAHVRVSVQRNVVGGALASGLA